MQTVTRLTLPKRKKDSHKGQNGRVLVIGGSEEFVGAVALAGIAALRTGVDLVIVVAPEKVAWAVNNLYPDLITKKLRGKKLTMRHWPAIKKLASKCDTILIGNGLGTSWRTKRLMKKVAQLPNRKVIDADGLTLVQEHLLKNTIITPHARELNIFLGHHAVRNNPDPEQLQKNLIPWLSLGNVLLQKGPVDIIISATNVAQNKTGNEGMTKGGTGDILAGLAAGFYSQTGDAWVSACNAAYVSGKIGDILKKKHKGFSYIASDMVAEIQKLT